jgi:diguanylate cyclase (GGDEF)-like protein
LPGVEAPLELARLGVEKPGRRKSDTEAPAAEHRHVAWLGLRLPPGKGSVLERLAASHLPTRILQEDSPQAWWEWLFVLGGALASHTTQVTAILRDPVTGLADRKAFQAVLRDHVEGAPQQAQPLSLLMINPDQFDGVNERWGREAGDQCVREISERLRPVLRMTDFVARYGGVVFAALLPNTPESEALEVAQRVLEELTDRPFLDDQIELGFSIGMSSLESGDPAEPAGPLEVVRRADRALNAAKRQGGNRIVSWRQAPETDGSDGRDRLSGIFTGNMSKDYRNMALLHDTIDILAHGKGFDTVAGEVVDKLYGAFTPDRIGIFTAGDKGSVHLVCGLTRRVSSSGLQSRVETVELEPHEKDQIDAALTETRPKGLRSSQPDLGETSKDSGRAVFVAPLTAGDQTLGCLFVEGRRSSLTLETADLIFLESLAAQVAVALDRARLTGLESERQEQERRRLRAELSELRQALQHVKMVYRSPEMEDLVTTVNRVAPTDATVLIIGESGTGKELLARTVHELSQRKGHPFVIVDCGAISSTLIESELFGHERGAYTGAQARRLGRLVEAKNGTVLLDEIGELPLEVQSKLLRFVQDKQFTTVGGSKTQTVDVRIVAATNRDLAAEVKAGRFREDLYHRLNVVCLEIPALRNRPQDILHLARHFLELFAVQYQKGVRQFTQEAEERLVRYSWPGNVRELQNKILQSVILCQTDVIGAEEMGTLGQSAYRATARPRTGLASDSLDGDSQVISSADLWDELRLQLGALIDSSTSASPPLRLPLGTWLRDDLLLEAATAADQAIREAATIVGMPESTYRRRLRSALDQLDSGLATRAEDWDQVRQIIADLTRSVGLGEGDLHQRTQSVLLQEILTRFPKDVRIGAQLLGVSPPTFRSRARQVTSEA